MRPAASAARNLKLSVCWASVMHHSKFVICIDNSAYPASLEVRKLYEMVTDKDAARVGQIRVIDESGESYLYPAALFVDANLSEETQAAIFKTV